MKASPTFKSDQNISQKAERLDGVAGSLTERGEREAERRVKMAHAQYTFSYSTACGGKSERSFPHLCTHIYAYSPTH
ncbi:hypothetical protein SRHO_G00134860 [Serrasalmus rhombeus]